MFQSLNVNDLKNTIKYKFYKRRSPEEWLKLISEICQMVLSLRDKPTKFDYLAFAIKTMSDLLQHEERNHLYGMFEDMKWVPLTLPNVTRDLIVETFATTLKVDVVTQNKSSAIFKVKVDDVTFGWCQTVGSFQQARIVDGSINTDCLEHEKVLVALRKCIWDAAKTNHIVIGSMSNSFFNHQVVIYPDDFMIDEAFVEPDLVNATVDRIKKFKALGLSRSLIFHGVPGTGKSTIMRAITRSLDARSVRIKTSDIANNKLTSHFFESLIQITGPTVIIIDDLDRIETKAALILDTIEKYNGIVNVVMASMNRINAVDAALIRPGRFDEHVLIDAVDQRVLSRFVADEEPEIEVIKTWPIAFIREYAKVVKIFGLGSSTTRQLVDQLKTRVHNQREQYETMRLNKRSHDDDDDGIESTYFSDE